MSATSDRLRRFAGTPREIGRAAGQALGPRLEENIARYIRERPRRPGALDLAALRGGALPWLRTLPQRFQDELEGLAEGAKLPLQRVAEWNYVENSVDDGCSGFVGRLGGHVWVARNNDMFVPGIWGFATIREVTGRIPTLCFGQEGDVFTATGINRDRLWLHHQALPIADAPRPGRPHLSGWVLLTDMLETCSTVAEVEARLDEVDRDDAMLLFAVDGKCAGSRSSSAPAAGSRGERPPDPGWSRPTTRVRWARSGPRTTRNRATRGWKPWQPSCTRVSPAPVCRGI